MPTRKICGRHNSTADAIKEQLRGVEERFKAVEALNAKLLQGRIDASRVDATTEADIQRQIEDDVAEAMKAAATYRQPSL